MAPHRRQSGRGGRRSFHRAQALCTGRHRKIRRRLARLHREVSRVVECTSGDALERAHGRGVLLRFGVDLLHADRSVSVDAVDVRQAGHQNARPLQGFVLRHLNLSGSRLAQRQRHDRALVASSSSSGQRHHGVVVCVDGFALDFVILAHVGCATREEQRGHGNSNQCAFHGLTFSSLVKVVNRPWNSL